LISIDQKISLFTKLIVNQLQEKYDLKVAELEKENAVKLEAFKSEVEKKGDLVYRQYVENAAIEKKIRLSRVRSDCKKNRLKKQQELTDNLMDEIINKARHFIKSDEYIDYIDRLVKNHKNQIENYDQFYVYITKRDYDHHIEVVTKILESYGFSSSVFKIKPSNRDMIGGLSVVHKKRVKQLDLTLRARLEENRSVMGNAVYKMLKEAGEINEVG